MRATHLSTAVSALGSLRTGCVSRHSAFDVAGWRPWKYALSALSASSPAAAADRRFGSIYHARSRRTRSQQLSPALPASSAPPLLSTDIPTLCSRRAADFTLPPPPPFPIVSPPLSPRAARFVSDLLFTPSSLRPWPVFSASIQCPLLVDHANLLLALAYLTPGSKRRRRLRHMAAVTYERQQLALSADELSAVEAKARRAIDGALRGAGGGRLTPLRLDAAERAGRAGSARRAGQAASSVAPSPLQPPPAADGGRDRAEQSETRLERGSQAARAAAAEYAKSVGLKAWKVERAEQGFVSPCKWRVPGHLRWLMWQRSRLRQAEAALQRQNQHKKGNVQ